MSSVPQMTAGELAEATGDYAAAGLPEPMTGERFRALWEQSGLSIRRLAEALRMEGANAATRLREMARGTRPIQGPTAVAMEAIATGCLDDDMLEQAFDKALRDCEAEALDATEQFAEIMARACVRALREMVGRPGER